MKTVVMRNSIKATTMETINHLRRNYSFFASFLHFPSVVQEERELGKRVESGNVIVLYDSDGNLFRSVACWTDTIVCVSES